MLKLSLTLALVVAFLAKADPDVIVTGNATDCFEGVSRQVPDLDLYAFDISQGGEMLDSLRRMDLAVFADSDTTAMPRFEAQYERVISLVGSSTPLAHSASDSAGTFAVSLTPTDSVLIFAYREREDEPFYYAYKAIGGRTNGSITLDMSHGDCPQ